MPLGSGMGSSIFCSGAICSATAQAVIVCVEDMIAGMFVLMIARELDQATGCLIS